jgi:predicted DNA-binding transcriptional regulator YafY
MRQSRNPATRYGWTEAWISVDSIEAAVMDILALGTEVEVVDPPELRNLVRDTALNVGRLYGDLTP